MFKKSHCIYTALIAALALSACSSDAQRFEGRLAIERDACSASDGVFKAGDGSIGESSCKCNLDNGMSIECFGSWVCDKDNLTCRECVDGDTKCIDGNTNSNLKAQVKTCVAGKWTNEVDCDIDTCSEDKKTCAPKPECKSICDGNILITCSKDNGVIKQECVECDDSDGLPKCKCPDNYDQCDGDRKIKYCKDGVKLEEECKCENGRCVNETSDTSCNMEGRSKCVNLSVSEISSWRDDKTGKEYQIVQQQCSNNEWTTIRGCDYGCTPDGTICENKEEPADIKCADSERPEGATGCECIDGEWKNCTITSEPTECVDSERPEGATGCECIDGEWKNCTITSEPKGQCKDKTYQCNTDHVLKCVSDNGKDETIDVTQDMVKADGCLTKDGDARYFCQNEGQKNVSIEDACRCDSKNDVYCFNHTGYLCDSTGVLNNIGCTCKDGVDDWLSPWINGEDPQCYYRCQANQYSCGADGKLRCKVDAENKPASMLDTNIVSELNYNNTNTNISDKCISEGWYKCDPDIDETSLNNSNAKCCNTKKLLCFEEKAYKCNNGKIEKPISCKICGGEGNYGKEVNSSDCSASPETQSCGDSGYYCKDKNSLICSLEGKLENGKTDDICCKDSESDIRPSDIHCEGCVAGYYRCGATYQTTYSAPDTSIGTVSRPYKCTISHTWEQDNNKDTHVLGIVMNENYYRLFDCSNTSLTADLDYISCTSFSIDGSENYSVNNPENLNVLYKNFKEENFNSIEFSCLGSDVGNIVNREYYAYVQRNYNKDFSDNIGTNRSYLVTAERGEKKSISYTYKVTISKK
ncbi:MAG: hypothetical protein J6A01_11460 [Proteobacteria bacterium]|nr:hypothetical protein [Pseudomonadota bacterium]